MTQAIAYAARDAETPLAPFHFERRAMRDGEGRAKAALETSISVPMARFGAGEDLSGCLLFLASDLSSYMTGTVHEVTGGRFM